ncbi:CGNR zinc finger domain-containing protein [Actinoallomurus rhizosphaericola]|uniref:CGNR zinc finger domain-containing protein n=1 Tax=Actinoallomurus rhizosphaericola TaxID=2952536 RepID=UPI0020916C01|nr:ABATE domain-containing protein [Actinoallomurus rhizosphaericola]MCO5993084.1 ABATE domain-containing protein [Actinoallomurus rhizosphaericola]
MADWLWDGGRASVDLVNTIRDRKLGGRETLRTPADLAAWLREAGLPGAPDDAGLRAVRRLREAIDLLAFPGVSAADRGAVTDAGETLPRTTREAADVVNAAIAAAPPVPTLALDDAGRPVAAPREESTAAALARLAVDAVGLLTGDDLLRVCAAPDCGVRFVDRSPARNRQWCSMRRCGNRHKARRHYDRTRS